MTIEYRRRFPRTRRHLLLQTVVSVLILQPLLIWRLANERLMISIALFGLVLAALTLAYRSWRFLTIQEQQHSQPTPEMSFVFTLASVYPLAVNVFLLILLAEM